MSVEWPAANCLRVDVATVEAVGACREAGVEPLLLKGPVIARWLYPTDPSARSYHDTDLLVAPDDLDAARGALRALGYDCARRIEERLPHGRASHAECWYRDADRAAVDLHRCIHRTERADPSAVWAAASRGCEQLELLGTAVSTPNETFRLLHAVLHLGPRDRVGSKAWTDLDTAIRSLDRRRWEAAAAMGRRLGVADDMGALLRRHPLGGALADELALPRGDRLRLRLELDVDTYASRFLAEVLEVGGVDGLRLLVEKAVPPRAYLRLTRDDVPDDTLGLVRLHARRLARWRRRSRGMGAALRAAGAHRPGA